MNTRLGRNMLKNADLAIRPRGRAAGAALVAAFVCVSVAPIHAWGKNGATAGSTSAHHHVDRSRQTADSSRGNAVGSREPLPLGVAPPPEQHWHLQADDNFSRDNSVNQALWNGGTGGGMPRGFCGTPATSCGYTGDDCRSYFGTYPKPPYDKIIPGKGLAIQATHAKPGDLRYYDNKMTDIQDYGKLTIHPGSFVQWRAKMPTDRHGEGNGWHVDIWCSTLVRHRCDDSAEVDVMEKIISPANNSKAHFVVHDQPTGLHTVIQTTYSAPGKPDLSAAYHTYGLFWRNDHLGREGSLQGYIDGKPIVNHPVPINDPSWGSGAYCYAGWMQQELEVWGGGVPIDSRTSSRDPLYVRRFTVWKTY